jgi:hypothetical protein
VRNHAQKCSMFSITSENIQGARTLNLGSSGWGVTCRLRLLRRRLGLPIFISWKITTCAQEIERRIIKPSLNSWALLANCLGITPLLFRLTRQSSRKKRCAYTLGRRITGPQFSKFQSKRSHLASPRDQGVSEGAVRFTRSRVNGRPHRAPQIVLIITRPFRRRKARERGTLEISGSCNLRPGGGRILLQHTFRIRMIAIARRGQGEGASAFGEAVSASR